MFRTSAIRSSHCQCDRAEASRDKSGLTHGDEALKRPPRGYAADHPLIEDLKQTSFTVGEQFTERQACGPAFPDVFIRACRCEAPLIRFLARAMNLPF
jgi:uncharacterized protein (DUF2461 family)